MRGLSPITIGLAVLATLVLGVALVVWVRAPSDRTTSQLTPESEADPAGTERPPPAAAGSELARREKPPIAPPPAMEPARAPALSWQDAATAAASASDADAGIKTEAAILGKGLIFAQLFQRRRQAADERAFESLKLTETTREAIRRIDASRGEGADNVAPERARHEALIALMGSDAAKRFDAAERVAVQQVRGKYRLEGARLLHERATAPAARPAAATEPP